MTDNGRHQTAADRGRTPRRAWAPAFLGAGLALALVMPVAVPASAAENSDVAERQSWSLAERAEHDREFAGDIRLPEGLPATEVEPDEAAVSIPHPRTHAKPISVTAAARTFDLPETKAGSSAPDDVRATVGGLPVQLESPGRSARRAAGVSSPDVPESVRVSTLDTASARALGVEALLTVAHTPQASPVGGAGLGVSVDYRGLIGGNPELASRLGLVALPACALSTPEAPACQVQTPLPGQENQVEAGTVAAVVEVPATDSEPATTGRMSASTAERATASETMVLAVAADASGSEGDWKATPLSGAAAWETTEGTGSFTWSYPFRAPGAAGGLVPDVSLSYDSGSVDGRVASANTQTSEIGEGWDLATGGYVERKFVPCVDDQADSSNNEAPNNADYDTGDLCWKNDNATLVLGGKATDLIKDEASGKWRLEADDNSKVESLTGGWNADHDKEYWKVTTADGTQYWFGRDKRATDDPVTNLYSAWTVPVFGNHPGEPCYANAADGGFAASSCRQAWRWNLDYVVDTSGNTMTYRYEREWNNYGRNNNKTDVADADYVRGGFLDRIDYGTRSGTLTGTPSAVMDFNYSQRCIPTSSFDCGTLNAETRDHWPDVPQDQICSIDATSCSGRTAPTFFTRNRLTGVETKILKADGTYRAVESWALTHSFPDAGDGLDALWLGEVTHTGKGGGSDIALPATQFGSVQRANRVAAGADRSAMNRMRIGEIRTESGAMVTVTYAGADCTPTSTPTAPESNTRRCMPVWWTPAGNEDPVMEWFHKYVVTKVIDDPRDGGSDPTVTSYNYSGGTAWRYTDDELTLKKYRTWSDWRGFATVNVYTGDLARNPDITRTRTQYEYFRGMHGDRESPAGGTKNVPVTDVINDLDQWAGMVRKETVFNGSAVVSTTVNTPWRSSVTATDADGDKAFYTGTERTETTTTTPDRTGGNLVTRTDTGFDALGRVKAVSALGDVALASDDTCVRTTYIDNTTANILDTVRRVETAGVACSTSPAEPGDVVSDQRYAYDGSVEGDDVPTKGLVTTTQEAASYSGTTPVYVDVERTTYDGFGRPETTTDAKDRVTTTTYSTVQNLTTGTTVTSPDPDGSGVIAHKTTTVLDPAWGVPTKVTAPDGRVTSGTYDALGRLTSVWEPGRVQGTHTASRTYAYTVRSTGVNAVTTSTLKYDASGYLTSVALYDGLLRERQTQSTSASDLATGRVITDTTYDTRGLAVLKNHAWHNTAAPGTTVVTTSAAVPGRTLTKYDGAGRVTEELFQVDEDAENYDNGDYVLKWSTTTQHRGDRTLVDPPVGGTPTTTITDGRGRTIALRQHTGTSPATAFVETTYAYDDADRLTRAVDDVDNAWTYTYDLRGRQTRATDPDKGRTDTTYDAVGNVLTTTDARGSVIGYTYDVLNRKTTMREGGTDGTIRARWTYDRLANDTVVPGQPASSTRVVGTGTAATEITTTVDGYEAHGQPTATTTTIPATVSGVNLGALAKAWTTEYTYTATGKPDTTKYPSGGGLPSEMINLAYDSADQVRGLDSAGHGIYVAAADYKPTGEVARLSFGNTYAYVQDRDYEFGTNRLIKSTVVAEAPDGTAVDVQRAAFGWDHAGNLTSVLDTPAANLGGRSHDRQCYRYDGLRRLTQAWTPASAQCATDPAPANLGGAAPYWHTYAHDNIGNRTQVVENALPNGTAAQTRTYTRPASGPNAVRPHAVTSVSATGRDAGTSTYSWDAAGNMTGRNVAGQATQQLAWDVEGELTELRQDGNGDGDTADANERDSYVNSADGERVLRTQDGTTTLYLGYQELTLNHESGAISGQRYYSFGGETIATRTGYFAAEVTTIIGDHHNTGSVQIPNVAGPSSRVHRYTDPFGKPRGPHAGQGADGGADGNWTGEHGYLDKPVDSTGLTAIGARMYDAVLGVFVSVDPVMDLADPQQWNAYAYANNNPTTRSDPTGLYSGIALDPGSGGGCGCDNGYRGDDGGERGDGDGSGESGDGTGGSDPSPPSTELWWTPPVLSPEDCPGCWGLPVPGLDLTDHRPQWLADFEGAHPNIAAYSGISDYSGCFLQGGINDDSCNAVAGGLVLAPIGGGLGGAGLKAGVTVLGRVGKGASSSTVVMGRNMSERVIPYANANGYGYYTGTPKLVPRGLDRIAPNGMKRIDMAFNKRWINAQMRHGRQIVDIGEPQGYRPSAFYAMEREQVRGYQNYVQDLQP